MHNKLAFYDREDEKRANIDIDRINQQKEGKKAAEHALYLTRLENDEVLKKKAIHKRELDNLVNERAIQRSYAE